MFEEVHIKLECEAPLSKTLVPKRRPPVGQARATICAEDVLGGRKEGSRPLGRSEPARASCGGYLRRCGKDDLGVLLSIVSSLCSTVGVCRWHVDSFKLKESRSGICRKDSLTFP